MSAPTSGACGQGSLLVAVEVVDCFEQPIGRALTRIRFFAHFLVYAIIGNDVCLTVHGRGATLSGPFGLGPVRVVNAVAIRTGKPTWNQTLMGRFGGIPPRRFYGLRRSRTPNAAGPPDRSGIRLSAQGIKHSLNEPRRHGIADRWSCRWLPDPYASALSVLMTDLKRRLGSDACS